MSRLPKIATLCATLLAPAWAYAYQPLITDDTGTQGAGGSQVELSWDHEQADIGRIHARTDSANLTLTHGFADNFDLAVGMPWVRTDIADHNESGAGNVDLFAKWRLFEGDQGLSLALKPEVVFPVSASAERKGLGDHGTAYDLSLLLTQPTAFGRVDFNLGTGHYDNRGRGDNDNTFHASVAPGWQVTPNTRLALDLGLDHSSEDSDTSEYALMGVVYSPNKAIDLDAGIRKIFSDSNLDDDWATSIGLTWHI